MYRSCQLLSSTTESLSALLQVLASCDVAQAAVRKDAVVAIMCRRRRLVSWSMVVTGHVRARYWVRTANDQYRRIWG